MVSAYFYDQTPGPVIQIDFWERVYSYRDIPLFGKVENVWWETSLSVGIWTDTGSTKPIKGYNPPLLTNSSPEMQLFPENVREIKYLYDEALMLDLLEDVPNGKRIYLGELHKIMNSTEGLNRWVVFREGLAPSMKDLISGKFSENLRRSQ